MTCTKKETAICGAFFMVAFADGNYEPIEEARFLSTVLNDPALAFGYNRLVKAFEQDYALASIEVRDVLEANKGDDRVVNAIKMAARRAIVADEKIMPQEEVALDQIAVAIGLEKGDV